MQIHEPPPSVPDDHRLREAGFSDVAEFLSRYPDGRSENYVFRNRTQLVDHYLHGMCGVFAMVLHRRTGWPMVGIHRAEELGINTPWHVAVVDPEGGYVDARGRGLSEEELTAPYRKVAGECVVVPVDPMRLPSLFLRHPDHYDAAAGRFVDRLLPDLPAMENSIPGI